MTKGNIFEDLGFSKEEAAALALRTDLHMQLMHIIERQGYKPRQLEKILRIPQPRVSELLNGKISRLKLGTLVAYLSRLGAKTEVKVTYPKRKVA